MERRQLRIDVPADGGGDYSGSMNFEIAVEPRFLRARMSGRETGEETREFFRAVILEYIKYQHSNVLLDLSSSRPIFHVRPHGFLEFFRMLADGSSCKIALLGDARDLHVSHEYIALLARQQGMNVQSFRDETAALLWLRERRQRQERRERHERRQRHAQRHPREQRSMAEDRRRRERRVAPQSQLAA
jgi:stage II sporulation SpoAA-like protein